MFGLSAVDIVVGQQYTFIIESLTVLYMRESFICDLQGFVDCFYLPGGINSLVKEGGAKLRLNMKSEVEDIIESHIPKVEHRSLESDTHVKRRSLRTRITSIYTSFCFRPAVCSACHI